MLKNSYHQEQLNTTAAAAATSSTISVVIIIYFPQSCCISKKQTFGIVQQVSYRLTAFRVTEPIVSKHCRDEYGNNNKSSPKKFEKSASLHPTSEKRCYGAMCKALWNVIETLWKHYGTIIKISILPILY